MWLERPAATLLYLMSMKVSVVITTYNQEDFIAQAINSVLSQEVNFDYEIIIGEDASTDRTREIVVEIQAKNPDKIRVLLRDPVDAERDRAAGVGGKSGFVNCLRACQGQYVALLDGDDYWTDVHKLQTQADFLEEHPEYAICFHNAKVLRANGGRGPETFCPLDQKKTFSLEDLLAGNFIFSGSTMFRRGLFADLPDWFYTTPTGDWPLHILNAQYGKIGYLSAVMAVYRIHGDSWWSSKPAPPQLLAQIELLDNINAHLIFRYDRKIKDTQYRSYAELAELAYQEGDMIGCRNFLEKCLKAGLANYRLPSAHQMGRLFKLHNPTFFNLIRSLRNFVYPHRS